MKTRRPRNLVSLNGRLLPAGRARISVFDRGLLYGDAAFETVRVYSGIPFRWRQHHDRLRRTLKRLAIPEPAIDLRASLHDLIETTDQPECAVRITITRGVGGGLAPPAGLTPTVLLMPRTIPPELEPARRQGVSVVRLPFGSGRFSVTTGHKTTDYAGAVLGRLVAQQEEAFEAVYVEGDGMVSEATTSNLFVVQKEELITPPLATGCLPGITRALVLEMARRMKTKVHEREIPAQRLTSAREVFLTGSVIEVVPVIEVDGHRVGSGVPGPVTTRLQEEYRRFVRRSLAAGRRSV